MELFTLLASEVQIDFFGQTFDITLNWIGQLIRALIIGVSSVGVGVILFSLILKAIVLPFDVYQRINMRKQNIKMKENQARMEKLQKQYANDKDMYSKKLMEMYKENGISVMSSCLPMILSMVIFFVAIAAFNAYAQYSNVSNYNIMVDAYNGKIHSVIADMEEDGITVKKDVQGQYTVYVDEVYDKTSDQALKDAIDAAVATENFSLEEARVTAVYDYVKGLAQNAVVESYQTDVTKNISFLWIKNVWATDATYKHPVLSYSDFKAEISSKDFTVNDNKKASLTDAIAATYNSPYDELAYNTITGKLDGQKSAANGYYILIVLSIGTILLQQFISNRSQKEQQKYSTVDGQGATQQKTTMVIMTAMFAVFAFMYSAAFSIYMIMSNITSLVSMLIINKAVDIVSEKKEAKEFQKKYSKRVPGRTEVKKAEDKKGKNKK